MHSLLEGMVSVSSLFLSRTSYGWCWMWSPKRDQRPPRFSPIRGWPRKLPRAPSWLLEQRSKTSRYVVPIMFLSAFLSFFFSFLFVYDDFLSWWYKSIHDLNFSFRAFKILKYVQLNFVYWSKNYFCHIWYRNYIGSQGATKNFLFPRSFFLVKNQLNPSKNDFLNT